MSHNTHIVKENIKEILQTLAKEYSKLGGTKPINIYIVGGASIVLNFDYRLSTIDIDAYYAEDLLLDQAIILTAKLLQLPDDWLNKDFVNTPSYTYKIINKAKLGFIVNDLINVYLLEPKYLIAMKIKSSRPTGGDLEDIIMMIYEMRFKNIPISYNEIIEAYKELYSDFSNTYDYFLVKTQEAFKTPIEDFMHYFHKKY